MKNLRFSRLSHRLTRNHSSLYTPTIYTTNQNLCRGSFIFYLANSFQAFIVATSTSYCLSARSRGLRNASGRGAVLKRIRMRNAKYAGAVRSPGRRRWRLFGVLGSLPSRPTPACFTPRKSLGLQAFSSFPTKVKLGDLGGDPEVPPRNPQIQPGKRKWPSVAGWGRPEVTVPWGRRGGAAEWWGVCVFVCVRALARVCVRACARACV